MLLCHRTHQRALAGIAVAAATEYTPQLPPALHGKRAQCLQGLVQGVGGVGIVHRHQRLPRRHQPLHAARHGLQARAGAHGIQQRHTLAAQRGQHAQQVQHVVVANHAGLQCPLLCAFHHREAQPLVAQGNVPRRQPRRSVGRDAPQIQRAPRQFGMQLHSGRIVHVDDGRLQTRPVKQGPLGQPVVGHAAVVVEMVLGEIGEDGRAN